ncbi:MAG: hypothetical protein JW889_15650 [Verrucomicrobia bacterium]|nr:hypothetical protein [Verrucomicrobiota bacterium]
MTETQTDAPELPERKGVKCELCGKLADVEEVTTVRGRFYCRDCAEAGRALDELQPFREQYDNRAIRYTVLGCAVALVLFVVGSTVLLIYTFMRIDTARECKRNMEYICRALTAYAAGSSVFPPANNDLRPLFGPELRLRHFECPGTANTVTTRDDLKNDGTSPEGPGMSYFYQGGYRFPKEEGDAKLPLLWDQSLANHKDRGMNVIFKDGHHEYWTDRLPALEPRGPAPSTVDSTVPTQ